ncbi:MAG: lipocalin [Pelagimonas sp.]|uniref:lipocalin n=1 Tax=Pelagimonas sp. TaxID=2073170 RepID=UPI003D6BE222
MSEIQIPVRNPTAQVASQADVTIDRLVGTWKIVQGAGIAPHSQVIVGPELAEIGGETLPFIAIGPGRFLLGGDEIWVHWLDINNRTAAMGEPGGKRVWIMDKSGTPGERLNAARRILDWYGYDLSRMTGKP